MKREEEIKKAALEYRSKTKEYGDTDVILTDRQNAFEAGWKAADEHPKNPWKNVTTDEPRENQDIFAYFPNLCGGEYCKLTYLGNYRWSQDEGDYTTEFYNNEVLWMTIPQLPKGDER